MSDKEYMQRRLIEWTRYSEGWIKSLPLNKLRAIYRKEQRKVIKELMIDCGVYTSTRVQN